MSYVHGGVVPVCVLPHIVITIPSLFAKPSRSSIEHHGFSPPGGVTAHIARDRSITFTPSIHICAIPSRAPAALFGRNTYVTRCHWLSPICSKNGPTGCWPWHDVAF